MNKLTTTLKNLWNDESGQGATEYILLLVIVVGLAMVFKDQIMTAVKDKMAQLSADIGGFTAQ